ncbi:MAG TPA: hypothetical protein VJ023_19690 [Pyrinomonadaceae bacterium]|nr:hypothetical protein [Pyrinomonadaceae bacterium]
MSKIFGNFWRTAIHDPEFVDIAGTTNSGQGMAATLRLGNAFFSEGPPVYHWSPVNNRNLETTTNLTPRQYRALTILHEFAHALGIIPRDGPAADPSGTQSERNNQTIYEKCGAIIEAAIPLD